MTPRSSPGHSRSLTWVDVSDTLDWNQSPGVRCSAITGFLFIVLSSMLAPSFASAEGTLSPRLLADVVSQRADQLALIGSDEEALKLFTMTVGPALGLKDAAGALGARRLPSKMAKELEVAELSKSAYELMAALTTWQLADSIRHAAEPSAAVLVLPAARQEWLRNRSHVASLSGLLRLAGEDQARQTAQTMVTPRDAELVLAAERAAFESSQRATAVWWDIYGWRERIRQTKGQTRLCGTWQWIIHNHQRHGEQKSTIIFPPPGQVSANAATPVETIILGDAIYLRWEQNGQIQEDSLLFIKDDAKIEGSFVNNTGGWGPITAKRLAPCQP